MLRLNLLRKQYSIYIPGKVLLGKSGKEKVTREKIFLVFKPLVSSVNEFGPRKINIQDELHILLT